VLCFFGISLASVKVMLFNDLNGLGRINVVRLSDLKEVILGFSVLKCI
jgi:hypothetical protein